MAKGKVRFTLDGRDKTLGMQSIEHRFALTANIKDSYYALTYNRYFDAKHIKNGSSALLTPSRDWFEGTTCPNDCELSSLDSVSSWSEVPDWRKIRLGTYCFDILFIVKHITNQLNNCKNGNPYPMFPSNPFTFSAFSSQDLTDLRRRLTTNLIGVCAALAKFLSDQKYWRTGPKWMENMVDIFEQTMDFNRIFAGMTGDEIHINGYWVKKGELYHVKNQSNQETQQLMTWIDRMDANAFKSFKLKKNMAVIPDEYYFKLNNYHINLQIEN